VNSYVEEWHGDRCVKCKRLVPVESRGRRSDDKVRSRRTADSYAGEMNPRRCGVGVEGDEEENRLNSSSLNRKISVVKTKEEYVGARERESESLCFCLMLRHEKQSRMPGQFTSSHA